MKTNFIHALAIAAIIALPVAANAAVIAPDKAPAAQPASIEPAGYIVKHGSTKTVKGPNGGRTVTKTVTKIKR